MITLPAIALTLLLLSRPVCGQQTNGKQLHTYPKQTMDFSATVKEALQAWQNGDSKTFLSYFTANPDMTDDGQAK